jgi:gliding motility-associated-like protein
VTTITTPDASFNFMPVQPDILHTEVHFTNTTTGATSYNWNFGNAGNSTQTNPVFQFPENAEFYTIQLIALNGVCSDTTYRSLQIRDVLIYYIPNCFTPDGNQFNQVFQPVFHNGIDPYDFNMQIYNRWGEVIFESRDPSAGWDGTYHGSLVQDGMYSWRIEFKTLLSDERIIETGHVNKLQ